MTESCSYLRPSETIQKVLISTTSRMTGEYADDNILITHTWPDFRDASSLPRMEETPISRSGYIVTFRTDPVQKAPGVVMPQYRPVGEAICAYLSVFFGKRFDCHGMVEENGLYGIPDLTVYNNICNPQLPFNSHQRRSNFAMPLELNMFSSVKRSFADFVYSDSDIILLPRLDAACKFYMRALQNFEQNPEVAYLHLITAGEILSSFTEYPKEELLDQQTLADLDLIKNQIDNGEKVAKRISSRLRCVKRTFVKSLCSLLDEDFYQVSEARGSRHVDFKLDEIEKRVGAAYDLRSKYVHTGVPFGFWIEPLRGYNDLPLGQPSLDDTEFAKILATAPTLIGLERLLRYCLLRFMSMRDILDWSK